MFESNVPKMIIQWLKNWKWSRDASTQESDNIKKYTKNEIKSRWKAFQKIKLR